MPPMSEPTELLGSSAGIEAVRAQLARLRGTLLRALRPPAVLIQGETGTGKGLLARLLHRIGPRSQGPFVAINCAAMPEALMESLLFGHERGVYTGADRARVGLLQSGHRGVVFLDEVGLMPMALQVKLLVALEEGTVRRVGSTQVEHIDIWVISASNVDLVQAIREHRFREDLYHRLAKLEITLPPLRMRGDDIQQLADAFLARACQAYGLPQKKLSRDARHRLRVHPWPGNVRELANVMERSALMAESAEISAHDLSLTEPSSGTTVPAMTTPAETALSLRDEHQRVLDETGGNITRTAERLEISRNTLRARIRRWNLRVGQRVDLEADVPVDPGTSAPMPDVVATGLPAPAVRASPARLRWDRQLVTALAVSLAPVADTQPYELAPLFEDLIAKARSFEGWIEELTPVSLMIAFSHPQVEHAPIRAVQASRAMLKAIEASEDLGLTPPVARLAIHVRWCLTVSGADVRGVDAADRRAMREALAEIATLTGPGEIVVSGDASRSLLRSFVLSPTQRVATVGQCYHLMAGEPTGFESGGRVLSPLIARDQELAALGDLLARAEAGQGQIVGLVGEPGVGKSRLVHELHLGPARGRVTWLEGRCVSYGSTTPYRPILEIMRASFDVREADPADVVSGRVAAGLEALSLPATEWAPYALHLLGIKAGTETLAGLTPVAIRSRTLELFRELILRGSRRRPIVFVVEDLQWIDQTSSEAVAALVDALHSCPVMVVTTYRPGYRPDWLDRSYATQLAVQPLPRDDSRAIVRSVAIGAELSAETAEAILDHAEGVPLFLEELARAVVDDLDGLRALTIPNTVHGVIASRLERLPIEAREVLGMAAVIGRDFSTPVLASVTGQGEEALIPILGRLQAGEFVHAAANLTHEFRFKHALTQEVAYLSLPDDRRRKLHGLVAEALERLFPDAGERIPEILAHHCTQADRRLQAVGFWFAAGQRAVRRSAGVEAIAHLTKGLEIVASLPDSSERVRLELALVMTLAGPLVGAKGYGATEVERLMNRARDLARRADDAPQVFPAVFGLWLFHVARADFDVAVDLATDLLGRAGSSSNPTQSIAAYLSAGVPRFYRGALRDARTCFELAIERCSTAYPLGWFLSYGQDPGIGAWAFRGWTLALEGYLDQAADAVDRAVDLARRSEHAFSLALALHVAGMVRHLRGEPEVAGRFGEEELRLSREQGFPFFLAGGLGFTGWSRVSSGDHEGGLALMREGARVYRTTGAEVGTAHLSHLADALVEAGHIADALEVLAEGEDRVARHGERAYAAEFKRIKGLAMLHDRPAKVPEAVECFRQAIEIARLQEASTLELRAALDLAAFELTRLEEVEARALVLPVYSRFKEGESCRDLVRARELLRAITP